MEADMGTDWVHGMRRDLITGLVLAHPESRGDLRMGFSSAEVFNHVIEGGQADFNRPYQRLSPDDRALLYAFFNQPRHLQELTHAFSMLFAAGLPRELTVLDLGCGPATTGLALAAAAGAAEPFRYVGLDRADAMLKLAEKLWAGASARGALHRSSRGCFVRQLDDVALGPPSWSPVLVVASLPLREPDLGH